MQNDAPAIIFEHQETITLEQMLREMTKMIDANKKVDNPLPLCYNTHTKKLNNS